MSFNLSKELDEMLPKDKEKRLEKIKDMELEEWEKQSNKDIKVYLNEKLNEARSKGDSKEAFRIAKDISNIDE